jgi:hypothetical protein
VDSTHLHPRRIRRRAREGIAIAIAAFTAFGSWLGIGALPGTKIEPFYGAQDNSVKVPVPSPPADPEPAKP